MTLILNQSSVLSPAQSQVLASLAAYCPFSEQQIAAKKLFVEFVQQQPQCCARELSIGHLTASVWLVNKNQDHVLLTHHKKLNCWLQLGGHLDGDSDLARGALREALEESGLQDLSIENAIYDLDRHRIPARKTEPEHWHYDVRFVVRTMKDEQFIVSDESHALAWRSIEEIANDESMDTSVRRMAQNWLHPRR